MLRLSREKVTRISHQVAEALRVDPEVILKTDLNEIRLEIVKVVNNRLKIDEMLDQKVRDRIASFKRKIPEGGQEWQILYRRYYEEEINVLGKVPR
ncbi:MAG TPA: DUF507 family protein [Acidobacteriota bacterium]|jgi:hypothetical protein|nr:DUF507 family protein [Acidobacteriota bacterium]